MSLLLITACCASLSARSLDSSTAVVWSVSNATRELPARVPGVVHQALLDAGVLQGDPLYRYNELAFSWVAQANWTYRARFDLNQTELRAFDGGTIQFEGLDTVASVSLNGAHLGDANSAFVRWRFGLPRGALVAGTNTLTVAIAATLQYARAQATAYPYPVPASLYYHTWSENCTGGWNSSGYPGECGGSHRNFVRKSPTDFGWDWGPSFLPVGITGGVVIEPAVSPPRLRSVGVRQRHHPNGSVTLNVFGQLTLTPPPITDAAAAAVTPSPMRMRVRLCHPDCDAEAAEVLEAEATVTFALTGGAGTCVPGDGGGASSLPSASASASASVAEGWSPHVTASLLIAAPKLWWPRGYGAPELYELRASLLHGDDSDGAAAGGGAAEGEAAVEGEAVAVVQRVGLRTVELVQVPLTWLSPLTPLTRSITPFHQALASSRRPPSLRRQASLRAAPSSSASTASTSSPKAPT